MRARGADVLAQLGVNEARSHAFPEASQKVLLDLLERETAPRPLSSAIYALGHIQDHRSAPSIINFVSNENHEVRCAVAYALGSFSNDPTNVAPLLTLMSDQDESVRDWATFSLGVLGDLDTEEIREAFVRRLEDPHVDTRLEAMVSLGKRKDPRVLPTLIHELEQPEEAMKGMIEAACLMLDLAKEPDGWASRDYASALREHYPTPASLDHRDDAGR